MKLWEGLTPEDILDYIYAVLHSPSYRAKYREFLKIDFPRVPYPSSGAEFSRLVKLGWELRSLHLMEFTPRALPSLGGEGNNVVEKKAIRFEGGRVYFNANQYFDGVDVTAWSAQIGGYTPAQKWLKDRDGRELTFDDLRHYQKTLVALAETERVMKEVG